MGTRHSCFVIGLALALTTLSARESTPVSVRGVDGFARPEGVLRELVNAKRGGQTNNFCVVGYKDGSGAVTAWVHWVERRSLILWEPADPPAPLGESRRYLDLQRDVVASDAQLKGSSYLVTKPWVDRVLADCKGIGDRYVVRGPQPRSRK